MNKEQIEFLVKLQNELKTQENDCQANPRFWVVAQYKMETCWKENSDELYYCDIDGCYESFEELLTYLKENFTDEDFSDVDDFFDLELDHPDAIDGFNEVPMHKVHIIEKDTFFLTKRECQEHIKRNSYHYNDTVHTYAMTAWRSPQVEQLIVTLSKANFARWEKVEELLELYKTYTFSTKVSERIKTRDLITFVENEIKELENE